MDMDKDSSVKSRSKIDARTSKKSLIYQRPGNSFITFLRGWIAFVGVMAMANTVQCFVYPDFVWEKLYNVPASGANPLTARTYGMWTFLASIVRFLYSRNPYNFDLFLVTLATFLMAFVHFLTEVLYYQTGLPGIGMFSPIIVSGVSVGLMLFSINYIWPGAKENDNDEELVDLKHFPRTKKVAKQQD